ncbi:MAG: hypothetical protein AMXMBFR7_25150 [Planctomycetota bacterium]|nr:hypothetical protein [Planctomycetota bacterium]
MGQYVLKILIDVEARDDLDARRIAAELVQQAHPALEKAREIVLQDQGDRKSIRLDAAGAFQGSWNRGGPGLPPGRTKA